MNHVFNKSVDKATVQVALSEGAATFEVSQNKYAYGPSEIVDLMQSYYRVSMPLRESMSLHSEA